MIYFWMLPLMLDGRGVDQDTVKELVVLRGIATLIGLGATVKGKHIIRVYINKLLSISFWGRKWRVGNGIYTNDACA